MLNQFFRVMLVSVLLLLLQQSAWAADITVHDVYARAQAGQINEALSMMQQVLREHPNSGQAHFVDAELLARTGQIEAARGEFSTAKQLSPELPFARPSAVQALQRQLNVSSPVRIQSETSHGISFSAIIMIGLLILSVVLFVSAMRRRAAMQAQSTAFGNVPPAGYSPGYGPGYGQSGGLGSGILGGLATGAALGAGMVAGEALANRLMDGHDEQVPDSNANPDLNHDMGGNDFGLSDSSWDSGSGGDFGSDIGGGDWS